MGQEPAPLGGSTKDPGSLAQPPSAALNPAAPPRPRWGPLHDPDGTGYDDGSAAAFALLDGAEHSAALYGVEAVSGAPVEEAPPSEPVCLRCHRLTHYSSVPGEAKALARKPLLRLPEPRGLVVLMVDLLDFPAGLDQQLRKVSSLPWAALVQLMVSQSACGVRWSV